MKNQYLLPLLGLFFLIACQPGPKPSEVKESVSTKTIAFIGSYTQKEGHVDGKGVGVSIYETGPKTTDWKLLSTFSDIINPSYICLSPKHPIVYAVSEQGPDVPEPKSVIKVIQYDEKSFAMRDLQSISALGHAPCYISVDRSGDFLMVANYVSGNVVQYPIKADGTLAPGISSQHQGSGPDPRQEAAHAHFINQHPRNDNIYAVDLGTDQVLQYESRGNGLEVKDSILTQKGAGPRHLVWHPAGTTSYILNELNGSIEAWTWAQNKKERIQSISLIPKEKEGFAGSADIHISRDGHFVYASIRGDFNEMLVLKVDPESQRLEIIQRVSAGGEVPRNFSLSPDEKYLAVALQNSDRIMLFARDQKTGKLSPPPEAVEIKTPVCIQYKK